LATKRPERRPFLEIIASILDACQNGTIRTRIMYQCKMNSKQFTGYLDLLLEANLLLINNDRQHFLFTVSSKGREFLKAYNGMKTLVELP
jgi:predicted transcriptional regulator